MLALTSRSTFPSIGPRGPGADSNLIEVTLFARLPVFPPARSGEAVHCFISGFQQKTYEPLFQGEHSVADPEQEPCRKTKAGVAVFSWADGGPGTRCCFGC